MKPLELLGQQRVRDGTVLKLVRRGDEYLILADGQTLMSSRMHGSEEALAELGCRYARSRKGARVLVGGLGMGFTLRATLDLLEPDATVVVAELVPAVLEWNRRLLGPLAEHPLGDPRVRAQVADVAEILAAGPNQFDAVLLDVDNGPAAFTAESNAGLYDEKGIADGFRALKRDGVLAVWSAREDRKFAQRLRLGGFKVNVHRVRGRRKASGPFHAIVVGEKPSDG